MKKLSQRMTYANVAATAALVVAVGGGGAAVAAGLAKNSVGSPQIKSGAVKTADLGGNAVTGAKIKKGAVSTADLAPGVKGVARAGAVVSDLPTVDAWFNRAGGKPFVEKTGTGFYEVSVPGITAESAIAHVTSQTGKNYCNLGTFEGQFLVSCYDPAGTAQDTTFHITVH